MHVEASRMVSSRASAVSPGRCDAEWPGIPDDRCYGYSIRIVSHFSPAQMPRQALASTPSGETDQRGPHMTPLGRSVGSALLAGSLLCSLAGGVVAQQPTQAQSNAIRQSCRSDYQANCASVPTGGKASLECLQQHQAALSPACKSAVAAVGNSAPPAAAAVTQGMAPPGTPPAVPRRQELAMVRNACGADFRTYCRGVRLGGGQAMECLAANEARLSPSCRGALAEARGGR
jgi:hypothetical protein